jgi:hypothetical protein
VVDIIDPFDTAPSPGIVDPFDTAPAAPQAAPAEEDKSFLESAVDTTLTAGEEFGRAIPSAVISLAQGITEMGAAGLDLALGTNTSRAVTDNFEYVKSYVKPQTAGGQIFEDVLAFGLGFVPIAGWLGRANSVAKATKAGKTVVPATSRFLRSADNFGKSAQGLAVLGNRAKLIGTTAAAAAGYETLFTPDGRVTLSDTFSLGGPLETEGDVGLSGREEALRRIRNKLRSGAEAGLLSGAFDTALYGVGKGVGAIGQTDAASAAARGIRAGLGAVGKGVSRLPGAGTAKDLATRYLTASGGADARVFEEAADTTTRFTAIEGRSIAALDELQSELRRVTSKPFMNLFGKGKAKAREAEADMYRYFTGTGPDLSKYGPKVAAAGERALMAVNRERDRFYTQIERELDFVPPGDRKAALEAALRTMDEHAAAEKGVLRRVFQVHKDPLAYYKSLDLRFDEAGDVVGKSAPGYKKAVSEVARNLNPNNPVAAETQALARYTVNKAIGLEAINTGMNPADAIKETINKFTGEVKSPSGNLFAKDMPRFKMTRSLVTPREPAIDKSPALRELLGEITDPRELYIQTVGDLAKTSESLRFYRSMATSGATAALADAVPAIRNGAKPLFVKVPSVGTTLTDFDMGPFIREAQQRSLQTTLPDALGSDIPQQFSGQVGPEEVIQSYIKQLELNGYVPLGELDPASKDLFVGPYGQLTGLYVTPETYRALSAPARLGITGLDEAVSILAQLKGLSQKMTVVPSIASQMRSAIGNLMALAGTANLGRSTDVFDVFQVFTANLENLDKAGLDRMAKVISLSGTSESNLVIKALQEYKDTGNSVLLSGKLRNLIEKGESLVPFLNFFERTFSGTDSFFKGVAVISEQTKLLEALTKAGFDERSYPPELFEELVAQGIAKRTASSANPELTPVEVVAADAVKDMFPIYNRVGLFVRELDKLPILGAFTSFASENIRNSVNILDRGLKEMAFKVSDTTRGRLGEESAKAFEQSIRAQGAQRLTSYVATAVVVPKSAVAASMMATDTTPEQMQALYAQTNELLPGHDLIVIGNDQKGKIEFLDLSYVSPFSFVIDSATAGLRAYSEAGEIGKSQVQQLLNGVWAGVLSYSDPFASEAMSSERIFDVLPSARNGRTKTGSVVYNQSDPLSEKIISSINHLTAPYVPGYMRDFYEVKEGERRPGAIARAIFGMPTAQGKDLNLPAEFAKLVTGLKPMELNLRRDFQFAGGKYSPLRTEAKSAALRKIRAADRTPEEMMSAWNQYLDNLYREQSKLYADIQNARTLGLSDRDIRRQLIGEAKLGTDEVNRIMRGEFYPGTVSEELMQDIRRQERNEGINRVTPSSAIPYASFRKASRDRAREPLMSEPPQEEAPAAGGIVDPFETPSAAPAIVDPFDVPAGGAGGGSSSSQGAAPPPPAFDSMPAPSAPQLPTAPANRASLSPSLLGGDLASQMANMEIARRISGQ